MSTLDYTTLTEALQGIPDPRSKRGRSYEWLFLLVVLAAAMMRRKDELRRAGAASVQRYACAIDADPSMMFHEGDPKPIHLTEFGWSTYGGQGGVSEDAAPQRLHSGPDAGGLVRRSDGAHGCCGLCG